MKGKKHGILIVKDKDYQTKKIYNKGRLIVTCLFQPLYIKFENEMVNDVNQYFSGSWWTENDINNEALLNRVLNYQKPMAVIDFMCHDELKLLLSKIDKKLFYTGIGIDMDIIGRHYLNVARKGKMKDLFDLSTLKKDYTDNGITINIEKEKNKTLMDYFIGWETEEHFLKGLILGYPIQNTISIYKGGVKLGKTVSK